MNLFGAVDPASNIWGWLYMTDYKSKIILAWFLHSNHCTAMLILHYPGNRRDFFISADRVSL
jgi:hypothetical protein